MIKTSIFYFEFKKIFYDKRDNDQIKRDISDLHMVKTDLSLSKLESS